MLDSDLAELYQVETGALNRAFRRNLERFPPDFAFQVLENEWESLRCQIGILEKTGRGQYSKYLPIAFTQEGIAMLSGVLRSETAVKANIEIMRTFVRIKNTESENQALWNKLDQLEKKYDASFSGVFEAIRELRMGELPNEHAKIKAMGE